MTKDITYGYLETINEEENIIKIYEKFDYLAYWFRYQTTYLEMKYYLKQVLKEREKYYIKQIYYHDRNIGKTVALARLSTKYNIPVIVLTNTWKKLIEYDIPNKLPKYFRWNKPKAIVLTDSSSRLRYTNLLVEEGFNDDEMEIVKKMVLNGAVGYKNN